MNPDLRAGAAWGSLFATGVWGHLHHGAPGSNVYYRPLQMATYRLVIATSGVNPLALHVLSLTFAAASVLLAFGLFWKITRQQEHCVRGSCIVRRPSGSYRGGRLDLGTARHWLHDLCGGCVLVVSFHLRRREVIPGKPCTEGALAELGIVPHVLCTGTVLERNGGGCSVADRHICSARSIGEW